MVAADHDVALCHPRYQIRLPLAIQNLMCMKFQDGRHGGHLEYRN